MKWIEKRRFQLLLFATLFVLVLPAFSGSGRLAELIFWLAMTFLFVQSTIVADLKKSKRTWIWILVITLSLLSFLKPIGINALEIEVAKLLLIALFFFLVLRFLFRFVRRSPTVTMDVLITAVNIYFIFGIIAASLAFLLHKVLPDAYNFPDHVVTPDFITFIYYSFITMSTVGYGDIIPRCAETQTLAYFIAVTGQLYVAIIIAFLVGKFLVHGDRKVAGKEESNV